MTEKELRLYKVLSAADAVVSLLITVGLLLRFTGMWDGALNLCVPLLGVSTLISGLRFKKSNKTVSIICFAATAFIAACCIGVFFF